MSTLTFTQLLSSDVRTKEAVPTSVKVQQKWGGVRVFERFTGTLGLSLFHIVTTLSLLYA